MGDLRRRSAPIVREVFRLRYLQQTAGGRANLAGQTQASNGATIQSLEDAIRDILTAEITAQALSDVAEAIRTQ